MNTLEMTDVVVEYSVRGGQPVRAVAGVDLSVDKGQIVGLVGESGCGKSSLARVAVGLEAPTEGEVRFNGAPVTPLRWRIRDQSLLGLQMVFQDPYSSLNPRRTAGAQLLDGIRGGSSAARQKRMIELLDRVGIAAGGADRYPHQFSGGQRQRLAIARALATEPSLIVADEPVTALDASSQAQVVNLLVRLVRELGLGMLFISHDLSLVRAIADRTSVMYLGKILEESDTEQLWDAPQHPYTRALIDAVPKISEHPSIPTELPGDVPDPAHTPRGCRFRARCSLAVDRCHEEPQLVRSEDRSVACWLA